MQTLNLIDPAQSSIQYKTIVFPDGQPHIKIDMASVKTEESCLILSRISSPADLLTVLFAKNTLSYAGFEKIHLYISYLLTARMDRIMTNGEPFSLKVTATLLNTAGFHCVKIFDPHSEVTTALIEKGFSITNIDFVKDVISHYKQQHTNEDAGSFCIVSPDAGALKKIHAVAAALGNMDVIECMKERDIRTGALSGFKVFEESLTGKTCFIIDDICDGGGTFIGAAAELKKLGAVKIILAVSHGIFSKGFALQHVDAIYCTDSFKPIEAPGAHVSVFPVLKYLV